MGICIGRRIEVLQIGDPLIVKVSGANVGIARRLAIGIEVRLDASIGDETPRWSTDDLTKNEDRPLQATSVA